MKFSLALLYPCSLYDCYCQHHLLHALVLGFRWPKAIIKLAEDKMQIYWLRKLKGKGLGCLQPWQGLDFTLCPYHSVYLSFAASCLDFMLSSFSSCRSSRQAFQDDKIVGAILALHFLRLQLSSKEKIFRVSCNKSHELFPLNQWEQSLNHLA